jgi:cellulose synthase/poly-beta-1,6-N-acetylglucosamine synthase-like glycosyltransferase
MKNSLALEYPKDKLKILWVTDGSDDGTDQIVAQYPEAQVLHRPERNGKIGAMNRGMQYVKTPLVVFCDANTMLGKESIRRIVNLFKDETVGCVSGEKRILDKASDTASGAGEGIYWKYESQLKKWDYELHSVVGAAGELFGIRTDLFEPVHPEVILDDFIISLRMAKDGFVTAYAPEAYATEPPVNKIEHEIRRKIRISSGGIQSIIMLAPLLNPLPNPVLTFQYISHRVLRWTLTPFFLFLLLPIN